MTRKNLLDRSIKEFEDKKQNALFWTCDKIFTKSGYLYIVKKESRPISCAFHYAKSFETSEEIGKYENVEIALNTYEELGFEGVVEYNGLNVAFSSQGNYNDTMQIWHYKGVGTFDVISNQFMVMSADEINNNLGVNSMEIMLNLQKDYPFVPSYFEAKSEKKYVMVDIDSSEDIGGALKKDGKYKLHKSDEVKLTFVNFTRDEALQELFRIQENSLKPDTQFGLMTSPTLENRYLYQIAFNWKSLTYISSFKINYYIKSNATYDPAIKDVIFEALETL